MTERLPPVRRKISFKRASPVKRNASIKRSDSFRVLARSTYPLDERLNIETLQSLTPYHNGIDIVSEASRNLLLNSVKMEPHVHQIFFQNELPDPVLEDMDSRGFPINKLATSLVAQVLSKFKDDNKFSSMIDKNKLEETLRDLYEGLLWKKLGFSLYSLLYPDVVHDEKTGVSIRDFVENGGHVWAERLLTYIMDARWTMIWLQRVIRGQCTDDDYNREMNDLFVKLHLLDPQSVIPAYQFLLNQKALPGVNLELATRNYLGGPLDCSVLNTDVEKATKKSSVPLNVSRLSLNAVEVFFGVEVDEFVVTECRNLDLWSGNRPDNSKTSKIKDRCHVM